MPPRSLALVCLAALPATLPAADPSTPKAPEGFKVELLLQAPQIEAPTALCVAPNGDVYFAEDPMDMAGPPTKNLDRIWLLKGGDPKKKILFADKLWAVMGLELVRDKLYVVHAPYVSVFTLDAEGKAKSREDLFTDLGPPVAGVPSFNDHIPSGIRMGMDGWLYVSIGDKGIPRMTRKEEHVGSVDVAEGRWRHSVEGHHISLEGGGVIRFRPDGSQLEVFACGTRNHLDVPLGEHDRIFVRDNTDDGLGWNTRLMYLPQGAFMGYPWAYKQRPQVTVPMIHDFGGGSPCGGWVYLDDGLPEKFRGRIFHCEWGQGKVWAVKVAPDGAGFKYVDQIAFLDPAGTAVNDFRPFTLRPTADGRGFYVTDWGFSGWSQPVKAGRLWKVTYTGNDVKPAPRGKDSDSVEALIKALDHPAHSERVRGQRALEAKGKNAAAALLIDQRAGRLTSQSRQHALWVWRRTNHPEWMETAEALVSGSEDAAVRIEAARVLTSYDPEEDPDFITSCKKITKVQNTLRERIERDNSPQVRFQAAFLGGSVRELAHEPDPWVCLQIVQSTKSLQSWRIVPEHLKEEDFEKRFPDVADALLIVFDGECDLQTVAILKHILSTGSSSQRQKAVELLGRAYKDRKPYAGTWWGTQPAAQKPPARVVAWKGTPLVREAVLGALADKDAAVRKAAAAALATMRDPSTLAPLVKQFAAEKDAASRADLVRAVAGLATPEATGFLSEVARGATHPEELRLEAVAGLERAGTPAAADALVALAGPGQSQVVQSRALDALAGVKTPAARQAAVAALQSSERSVRRSAVDTLAKQGDASAGKLLLPLLDDKAPDVRTAAVRALGALHVRESVPALVRAAANETTQFDAVLALAQMPDKRALPAYLSGLGSKNPDLRKASAAALAAVRDEVVPALEQLVKGNEVRPELLPELRAVYQSYVPVLRWRLIGPFPLDGTAHPPEKELRFDAAYKGAGGKEVRWTEAKADERNHGKVDLLARLTPNNDVDAYGYAEVESAEARDAELLVGSDDMITVWLNGKKVHEYGGDRGWNPGQDKVKVRLERGTNRLLVRCGNHSAQWEYSVAVSGDAGRYSFLKGGWQKHDLEAFRAYARTHAGDFDRGRRLFMDAKGLACVKCHAVGGEGGRVGPDLAGIGLKYKREDLMTSILEPSKVIAQGYETVVLTTVKGRTLTGVFKGETADAVHLADAEGKEHTVAKKDIDERAFSPVSTMPNGLNDGMTLQDFADLVAYLEARREEGKPVRK